MPMRTRIAAALSALATLAGCSGGASLAQETLTHGPFEIVAQGRRISTGAFPNTSGNPFSTMEVTGFSVRHRGKPVTVVHGERRLERFWRVVRLTDAPQPALLVSTTDIHLLTEEAGQLVIRAASEPSTDTAQVQWLDTGDGQPGPVQVFAIQKVDPTGGTELRGGRWLRLGPRMVLDVQTLRMYPIRPWVPSGSGRPMEGATASGVRALGFSPGRTQYVSLSSARDPARGNETFPALVVVDIPTGDSYGQWIAPGPMRFLDIDSVTPDWIAHYFRWTRAADGAERLEPRSNVVPLPWQGRVISFGPTTVEWRIAPVRPQMRDVLARFLVEHQGAVPAPDWMDPKRTPSYTFKLPGCAGLIAVGGSERHASLFAPQPVGTPAADCRETIVAAGRAFDAQLRAGAHASLFLP